MTLRNLADASASASEIGLRELLNTINGVSTELKNSVLGTLVDQSGVASSIACLSQPQHSAVLHLRSDVLAAIGTAYDRAINHCGDLRRQVTLWELVEGGNAGLSLRFAEVVAHLLQATRVSSGSASVGTGTQLQKTAIVTNAMQARVSFDRLRHAVAAHLDAVPRGPRLPSNPPPSVNATPEEIREYRERLRTARKDMLAQAGAAQRVVHARPPWSANAYGM